MSTEQTQYISAVKELNDAMGQCLYNLKELQRARDRWTRPEGVHLNLGENLALVSQDGTIFPGLERLHTEAVNFIDNRIAQEVQSLEALRFRLSNINEIGGE